MDNHLAREIIACLPDERTTYHYHKDRYAVLLLAHLLKNKVCTVSELKKTPYGKLLEKPVIKAMLANMGDGMVSAERLNLIWKNPSLVFLLTLSTWGTEKYDSYYQTSREGTNLVLQLNFSNLHEREYMRLVDPYCSAAFNTSLHPILMPGERNFFRETLAWARIDLDFETDEALIEEIQSDWIYEVHSLLHKIVSSSEKNRNPVSYVGADADRLHEYINKVLKPYEKVWAEAMLWRALEFIWNELGINTVYYHSYDTGCRIKDCSPPRALYTDLPRQFCFSKTTMPPRFLQSNRFFKKRWRQLTNPFFYRLQLGGEYA